VKKEVNREQKISSQARSAAEEEAVAAWTSNKMVEKVKLEEGIQEKKEAERDRHSAMAHLEKQHEEQAKQKEDEQGYADVAAHTKEKSEFAARQLSETEAKDARAAASRSSASAEVAHKHAASEVRREQKAEEVAAKARQAADHAKDGYPAGVEAAPKEVIVKQVEAKRVEMEIAHKLAVVAAKRAAIAKFDADKASQQAAKEQNVKKTKSGAVPLNATLAKITADGNELIIKEIQKHKHDKKAVHRAVMRVIDDEGSKTEQAEKAAVAATDRAAGANREETRQLIVSSKEKAKKKIAAQLEEKDKVRELEEKAAIKAKGRSIKVLVVGHTSLLQTEGETASHNNDAIGEGGSAVEGANYRNGEGSADADAGLVLLEEHVAQCVEVRSAGMCKA